MWYGGSRFTFSSWVSSSAKYTRSGRKSSNGRAARSAHQLPMRTTDIGSVGTTCPVSYLLPMTTPRRFRSDKQYVRSLFDSIACRYDLLNHFLSGGIDLYWRRRAIGLLRDLEPKTILDVATGTGDFAIAAQRLQPERITGIDISEEMLALGRTKVSRRGLAQLIELRTGDAEHIECDTHSIDAAIVAFGVRNFEILEKGLSEMSRVIRPGGRIVVLEFSQPAHFPFRQVYFFYFKRILPLVGRLISRNDQAYRYLPETVMNFPEGSAFLGILRAVGFSNTQQHRLTFGIVTVYTGTKSTTQTTAGTPS